MFVEPIAVLDQNDVPTFIEQDQLVRFQMVSREHGSRARRQLLHAAMIVHGLTCVSSSVAQEVPVVSKPAVILRVAEAIAPLPESSGTIKDVPTPSAAASSAKKPNHAPEVKSDLAINAKAPAGRAPQLYKKPVSQLSVSSTPPASTKAEEIPQLISPVQAPEIQVAEAPSFLPVESEEVLLISEEPLPASPVSVSSEQKTVPAIPVIVQSKETRASLASVETARLSDAANSDIANSDKITIYQRRMTSSTFEKKVVKAVSFDESTCKSFIVDSNNIALLGVKTGQARIEVIFDDGSTTTKLVSVESPVYRGEPVNQNEKIASLTQSLADMYPNASIELSVISGGVIAVRGEVKSELDARDIMVLVRQMFLVPIQDKLIVRR